MTPKLLLIIMFLMSRIGILNASSQCHTGEHSIGGMYLRGHTFKTYRVGLPEMCYFRCEEEVTCQSYNFVIAQKICELNNRTKEATPEDFMPDQRRFYMKRSQNRGTPLLFCSGFSLPFSQYGRILICHISITIAENSDFRHIQNLRYIFLWLTFGRC